MKSSRSSAATLAACIAAIVTSAGAASAAATLEKVIKNTEAVPGIAGVAWSASPFQTPTIDISGKVGLRGTLLNGTGGVTSSNNATMWYGGPGDLGFVARTGQQAPGLPAGQNVIGFQSQNLNLSPNGHMWFGGTSTAPSGYLGTGTFFGGITKAARNGEVLPGVGSAISFNPASTSNYQNVNNLGHTIVGTSLADGTNAMWVGNSASLNLAFQSGQSYAGLLASTTVRSVITGAMINGSGTLYSGILMNQNAGAGITDANNELLTTLPFGGNTFTQIAREGDAAPGAGGATYQRGLFNQILQIEDSSFFHINGNFNNLGHGIYSTGLEGAGVVGSTNNAALFYYDGTSANMLRRRGDMTSAVPGATYALNAQQAFNARVNNNDEVAMTMSLTQGVGGVTSANDATLMRTTLGSAVDTLLAREGSGVPIVPGALWGTSFANLMQNNAGQIVFASTMLDDPTNPNHNITAANDLALFAWDPVGGFSLIARDGESLASIGINLTLTGNWLGTFNSANAEGGANALSDNGWLTFRVTGTALPGFTDTSAIVRTLIPAPASAVALLFGGIAALRRRRRA